MALSALDSLFSQLRTGKLPNLCDRDDLWRWLAVVTGRKAVERMRHDLRIKRGGRLQHNGTFKELASDCPAPDFGLIVGEEFERLLLALGDETLRQIALMRMDDLTLQQIADRLGYVPRTVSRKIDLIRRIWEVEVSG